MNDRLKELGAFLASREDDLWELQNAALQLSVAGEDRQLVGVVAAKLGALGHELGGLGFERLATNLAEVVNELAAGSAEGQHFDRLFALVEALGASARGSSPTFIASLVPPHEDVAATLEGDGGDAAAAESGEDGELPSLSDPGGAAASGGAAEQRAAGLEDSFEDVDMEEIEEFCAESREHIQAIELNLVELEQTGDQECIAEVFRAAHSIKGGAQYLGLEATATVAHRMETLLDRVRSGKMPTSPGLMAVLLKGLDTLAALTRAAEQQQPAEVDVAAVVLRMDAALEGELPLPAEPREVPPEASADTAVVAVEERPSESAVADEDVGVLGLDELPETEAAPSENDSEVQLFADDYAANMAAVRSIMADTAGTLGDPEVAAVLTRSLHTIRGIAGFVGLGPMEELADSLELLTSRLFRNRKELSHELRSTVGSALDLLDLVFEEYVSSGEVKVDVSSVLSQIVALAEGEREQLGVDNGRASAIRAMARSGHPLADRFADLLTALDGGDQSQLHMAVEELEDAASLHGYEELAATADGLGSRLGELPREELIGRLDRMAAMVPQELDGAALADTEPQEESFEELLLGVPGIGPKKRGKIVAAGLDSCHKIREAGMEGLLAVRGLNVDQARMILGRCEQRLGHEPGAGEGSLRDEMAQLVREDDYDRELVTIYLDTTSVRVAALAEQVGLGEWAAALETAEDLVAAASYMGYEPLHKAFAEVGELLAGDEPDGDGVGACLRRIADTLDHLVEILTGDADATDGGEADESEAVELERIFTESAATHLSALVTEVEAFFAGMGAELLTAIQHHLSCLESAGTNIGRDDASEAAARLRLAFESLWMQPHGLSETKARALLDEISLLHTQCGLQRPQLELKEVAPPSGEAPRTPLPPVAAPVDEDFLAEDFLVDAIREVLDAPEETAAVMPPPPLRPASTEVKPPPPLEPPQAVHEAPGELLESLGYGGDEPPSGGDGSDDGGGPPDEPDDDRRALVEHQTTLRVDTEKIDDLMNMAAELVVNRSSLMVLGATMRDVVIRVIDSGVVNRGEASELRSLVNRFDEETNDLGRVSNQLQEGVMRMRMVPVKVLFGRVPRLVRDLALRSRRLVRVSFSGEDTELDKTVIEQLSDPLVHLIRNAIGHGIEPSDQRMAKGKPEEGHLRIHARHEGNLVILEVEDDGRGIDREQIRARLVSSGATAAAEAARLTDRELLGAVFLPGFSTASEISDVSGRGVGLDVVKRNIEGLGGQVEIFSEPGKWCRFVIRIPLTMAIMQALLVRVEGEVYSIPVSSVIQTVKLSPDDISTVENQEVITVRDHVIPLIRLGEVFTYTYHAETEQLHGLGSRRGNGNGNRDGEGLGGDTYVIVVQGEDTEIGIVVDSVVGGQDIVIKSLEDEQVDARGIAGGAILGDGSVTLILDVGEVQKMAIDTESFQRRRMSETLKRIERYLLDHGDEFSSRPS